MNDALIEVKCKMRESTYAALVQRADREGCSLSALCSRLLTDESAVRDWLATPPSPQEIEAVLRAVMTDPTECSCKGTGWTFNDKDYDGYPYGRAPYVEPTRHNGGYSPCGFCNPGGWDHDRDEKGELMPAERRWDDDEVAEIVAALTAARNALMSYQPEGQT